MRPDDPDADLFDPDWVEPDAVELPLSDVLDLHSFPPKEVAAVVREWLDAVHAAGYRELRIIHGRGVGVQRATVRAILGRDPRVKGYGDAPAEAGGWGATWVELA
jgi:dsDNA-specific endonuclease/ATPase MutS2